MKPLFSSLVLAFLVLPLYATSSFEIGGKVRVSFLSSDIVRVEKAPEQLSSLPLKTSYSVVFEGEPTEVTQKQQGKFLVFTSSSLVVKVHQETGLVSFATRQGRKLLLEQRTAEFEKRSSGKDAGAYVVSQTFLLDPSEAIYGLGNLENGQLSQRGVNRELVPGNVEDGIPVFLSVKGYGLYWDNYSATTFSDSPEETSFQSEVGDQVDYYFMYGGDADGVVAQMRTLTGQVPMFPLWTYGFWQSRERYQSCRELTEVVDNYRRLGVPFDGIILDWQYWGNNYLWNAMDFLNPEFAQARQMIDHVHLQHAHIIPSVWAAFGPATLQYREMAPLGMLFDFETWPQSGLSKWPPDMNYPSGARVYDAYHPVARDIYWKHLKRLFDAKVDGWWMDSTEPDHHSVKDSDFENQTYLGSYRKVRNAFPLMTVGGVYEHQRAETSDKRVFILTRSGYMGQQRYANNVWTGDVTSNWDNFRRQIPAALNFSLTGHPHVNSDIGGFFSGGYNGKWSDGMAVKNPAYQELYVRWMQFGAFSPMMRSHGTETPREIYYYGQAGEPVYDALVKAIQLRYRLLPYIYSWSWQVSQHQSTFMRALMMDFPQDKKTWNRTDQFMFGKHLLVAPVVEALYTTEKVIKYNSEDMHRLSADFTQPKETQVYLPKGTSWFDFWTGKAYAGGQEVQVAASIGDVPLFVPAGSILPLGPDVQYVGEKAWDSLDIRIYPGKDAVFTLYEDEGDNYNYEQGAYSLIEFRWHDRSRQLEIADRQGNFEGMLTDRCFRVTLVESEHTARQQVVDYHGQRVVQSF